MTRVRSLSVATVTLALAVGLSGCFGLPGSLINQGGSEPAPVADSSAAEALVGSTWEGVDSDGDSWGLEFQQDGTVGLTFNGDSYDDATDTWGVSGSTLTIVIVFDDGAATMTGPYSPGASSIDLDGSAGADVRWTLTITPV